MTRVVLAFILAGLALPLGGRHGVTRLLAETAASDAVSDYREAVQIFRAGRVAEATATLMSHGPGWLTGALRQVYAAIQVRDPRFQPLDIQAAMLLHLEIFRQPGVPPSDRVLHLDAAWNLEFVAARLPKDFHRQCRLLVVLTLQKELMVDDLVHQLGQALQLFPGDPELLLAKGSLWELLAELEDVSSHRFPATEAIREVATRTLSLAGSVPTAAVAVESPRVYEQCARVYERALRGAPQLHEARARLGRVLAWAGKFEEAVRALEPLLASEATVPARLRYFALLFHGRALLGLGRAEEAAASYRHADALFPGCQAPQIALSTALRAAGDQAGARSVMTNTLRRGASGLYPQDPWWDYLLCQAWRIDSLAASLQASVRQ